MKKKLTEKGIMACLKKNGDLVDRYGVKRIGLFGSYVRGTNTSLSDIDVLVEFNLPTFDNFMGLRTQLEKILHKNVDLVSIKALNRKIKTYILQEVEWV